MITKQKVDWKKIQKFYKIVAKKILYLQVCKVKNLTKNTPFNCMICTNAEVHFEPRQTSKAEISAKIVKGVFIGGSGGGSE